ncbi:hypothetical protein ACQ4PT_056849 [Festuca glaucescens]
MAHAPESSRSPPTTIPTTTDGHSGRRRPNSLSPGSGPRCLNFDLSPTSSEESVEQPRRATFKEVLLSGAASPVAVSGNGHQEVAAAPAASLQGRTNDTILVRVGAAGPAAVQGQLRAQGDGDRAWEVQRKRWWWRKERRAGAMASQGSINAGGVRAVGGQQLKDLLKKKAAGRCFKCLARDHRVSKCRDPPTCLLCEQPGHKARWCTDVVACGRLPPAQRLSFPSGHPQHNRQPPASRLTFPPDHPLANRRPVHTRITFPAPPPSAAAPSASGSAPPVAAAVPVRAMEVEIPGAPQFRPKWVTALASSTPAMAVSERRFEVHAVILLLHGPRFELSVQQVTEAISAQFELPENEFEVSKFTNGGDFLAYFTDPNFRNLAIRQELLLAGRATLRFRPWSRLVGGEAIMMRYHVRVCIEGIPKHGWQPANASTLFNNSSFIDSIDEAPPGSDKESACYRLWLWSADPNSIGLAGELTLEERPRSASPGLNFSELGVSQSRPRREGPVNGFKYPVIIHIDRVIDYGEHGHGGGGIRARIPSSESGGDGTHRYSFDWFLLHEDGSYVPPRRLSAHSRLGARVRDRSPPGGGAGSSHHHGGGGRRRHGEFHRQQHRPSDGEASGEWRQRQHLVSTVHVPAPLGFNGEPSDELTEPALSVEAGDGGDRISHGVASPTGGKSPTASLAEGTGAPSLSELAGSAHHDLAFGQKEALVAVLSENAGMDGSHPHVSALPPDSLHPAVGAASTDALLSPDDVGVTEELTEDAATVEMASSTVGPLGLGPDEETSHDQGLLADAIPPILLGRPDGPARESTDFTSQGIISTAPLFSDTLAVAVPPPLIPSVPATPVRRRRAKAAPASYRRTSDRLAIKSMAALSTIERARRILRKKWGLHEEDAEEVGATEEEMLQRFLALFKDPVSALEIDAVRALLGSIRGTAGRHRSLATRPAARRAAA